MAGSSNSAPGDIWIDAVALKLWRDREFAWVKRQFPSSNQPAASHRSSRHNDRKLHRHGFGDERYKRGGATARYRPAHDRLILRAMFWRRERAGIRRNAPCW